MNNDIILSSKVAFEIAASDFDMQTAKNEKELINAFIKFLEAKGYKVTPPPREVKDEYTFDRAWNLYEKKVGCKSKLEKKWNSMSKKDRKAAIEYIPLYVLSQPDKQYRKNFLTFLNQRGWEDELIGAKEPPVAANVHPSEISQLIAKRRPNKSYIPTKQRTTFFDNALSACWSFSKETPIAYAKRSWRYIVTTGPLHDLASRQICYKNDNNKQLQPATPTKSLRGFCWIWQSVSFV